MDKRGKTFLYSALLILGLSTFILELFVFQKPDGVLGLVICILSMYLSVGSIVKLCRLNEVFKNSFFDLIDLLFWLP